MQNSVVLPAQIHSFTLILAYATLSLAMATSPAPFSIISPTASAQMKNESGTPEAQHLLAEANANFAEAPDPLSVVHTEGTLPHHGIYDASVQAKKDWPLMLKFGLAYRLTGDPRYLKASDRFITAWVDVYQVSLNPIDETGLDQMILAYDVVRPDLSAATQEKMTTFLRTLAMGYLDKIANEKIEDTANWQSHRIKLITLAAFALNDPGLIARARQAFWRQVSVNIKPDGSVVDFYKRDALHYVVYDLEPLAMAALAAKAHGEDWFHAAASGSPSVKLAIDWLTPFALGQKTHDEFVHSTVHFDASRAQAGVKGYSGPWQPDSSIQLYQLAMLLDPKYADTLQQITANAGHASQDWPALLAKTGL